MRARIAGAFAVGFAAGVACLTVALWGSGSLILPSVLAGTKAPAAPNVKLSAPPTPDTMPTPPAIPVTKADIPDMPIAVAGPHLAMPIAGMNAATLADTFNDARDGRKHQALDIPAARNTPVHAVAEGNVVKLFTSKEGGLTVYQFDNTGTYSYYYAHLDHYANGLKEGMLLRTGEVLGYVGSTGNASPNAPHLHLAVNKLGADKKWWEGTPIDPLPLLR